MKGTIREYIDEGISIDNNTIVFDYNNNEVGIETRLGKTKINKETKKKDRMIAFESKEKTLLGSTVYFLYKLNRELGYIVKSIKDNKPYKIDARELDRFLTRSAIYANKNIKNFDFDLIVYPNNASNLLSTFVDKISQRYNISKFKISPSIKKLDVSNIEINDPKSKLSDSNRKSIEKILKRVKNKGFLKLHDDVPKQFRSFIKNFISLDDKILDIVDSKNILIIDDVYTTGSTIKELVRVLNERGASKVIGLTIFKIGK